MDRVNQEVKLRPLNVDLYHVMILMISGVHLSVIYLDRHFLDLSQTYLSGLLVDDFYYIKFIFFISIPALYARLVVIDKYKSFVNTFVAGMYFVLGVSYFGFSISLGYALFLVYFSVDVCVTEIKRIDRDYS